MEGFTKELSPNWRLNGYKLAKGRLWGGVLQAEEIVHVKAQRCEI